MEDTQVVKLKEKKKPIKPTTFFSCLKDRKTSQNRQM